MSDDLVKRLRLIGERRQQCTACYELVDIADEAADRIEQLEAIMQKLVEPFKKSAPLFGAQHVRSIRVGDQVVEELLAALEGKKDD